MIVRLVSNGSKYTSQSFSDMPFYVYFLDQSWKWDTTGELWLQTCITVCPIWYFECTYRHTCNLKTTRCIWMFCMSNDCFLVWLMELHERSNWKGMVPNMHRSSSDTTLLCVHCKPVHTLLFATQLCMTTKFVLQNTLWLYETTKILHEKYFQQLLILRLTF